MSKCAWCNTQPAPHLLDDLQLCCPCFDQLIEHSGNVKSDWLPQTSLALDRHGCWHARLTTWKEQHEKEKALRPKCLPEPAPER